MIGRLSADATAVTYTSFGIANLSLVVATSGNTTALTMSGFIGGDTEIVAQKNQLVYIGSDSGNFESQPKDTLVIDFSVGDDVLTTAYNVTFATNGFATGSEFHYVTSTQAISLVSAGTTRTTGTDLLGTVRVTGGVITVEAGTGYAAGIFTITTSSGNTTFAIAANTALTTTDERYVVNLANVDEAPTFDVAGADAITVAEGGEVEIEVGMLKVADDDASDHVDNDVNNPLKAGSITFTVIEAETVNGEFRDSVGKVTSFTLADVNRGDIVFKHTGGEQFELDSEGEFPAVPAEARATKFTLTATDASGQESAETTFTLNISLTMWWMMRQ